MMRSPNSRALAAFATLLIGAFPIAHAAGNAPASQQVHQAARIRIYYHTEGQHAVDPADKNSNGVPDQVEDVMTQTQAAEILWVEALGFPDPFKTERFRSASFLDIHFRHKDLLKSNGITYDELQRFKRAGDPPDTLSLCFNVATSIKAPENLTPAHEYFHVIQNSVTYFKNRWYTEGTARWSERGLGTGGLGLQRGSGAWPVPQERAASIFAMAYDASEQFWNPLCAHVERDGALPASLALDRLKSMRYTDGTPVLKDVQLTGWRFFCDVLAGLDKVDEAAFRELGYDRWSEGNQRSGKNDAYIMRVVDEALKKQATPSAQ